MGEVRTFDLDGWGFDRGTPKVESPKNPYARFSRGDRVVAARDFRDIVLRGGEHIFIDVVEHEVGTVVIPGPDAFGLMRVEFQGATLDAWESDLREAGYIGA